MRTVQEQRAPAGTRKRSGERNAQHGLAHPPLAAPDHDGRWAVRAYTSDSGTSTVRGPFATQARAEAAANRLDWQGY